MTKKKKKKRINIQTLTDHHHTDPRCRDYIEALRWPAGPACIRCNSTEVSRIRGRSQYYCRSCTYQFSVRVGTVLQDSHVPFWKWLLAIYMMVESNESTSALQISQTIGVAYKTAWCMCQKIRESMARVMQERLVQAGGLGYSRQSVSGHDYRPDGSADAESADYVSSAYRKNISDSYHNVSKKYLPRYIFEQRFKFNNADNEYLFRDTILSLIRSKPIKYSDIVRYNS